VGINRRTITIVADGDILLSDLLSQGAVGGAITVTSSQGSITANLADGITSDGDAGDGGAIQFTAGQGITLTGGVDMSSDSSSGQGGDIILTAQGGSLDASELNEISSQGSNGGAIVATSLDTVLLTDLNTSASGGLAGNITVTAPNRVQVGSLTVTGSTAGTTVTLTSDEIDFAAGAVSSAAENATLTLLPTTSGQTIRLGGSGDTGATALDLTTTDLGGLGNGFSTVTIGSGNLSAMTVDGAISFNDPVTFFFSDMVANAPIQGLGNASLTFQGDGNTLTLNATSNLTTQGQPILINDRLVLGANPQINTTDGGASGANIQITGTIDGTTPGAEQLGINAGSGAGSGTVQLGGAIGGTIALGGLLITGSGLTLSNNITTLNTTGTLETIVALNAPTTVTAPLTITAQQGRFVTNSTLNLGSNDTTLIVNGLRLLGGENSVTGSGTLTLQPFNPDRPIALRGLEVNDSEVALTGESLAAIGSGFTQVNLGDGINGTGTFFIDTDIATTLTLKSPFVLQGQSASSGGYQIRTGNGNSTFTLTAQNGGSITGDGLAFTANGSLSFLNATGIDAGLGSDTLVVSTGQDETIALADPLNAPILGTVAGVNFAAFETLDAQGTSDQLLGTAGADTIVISGSNSGTASSLLNFSGIENIDTGDGDDTLTLLATGSITGTLTGGAGTADRLDFSQQVGDLTVDLAQVGAAGMEVLIGNATGVATDPISTLRGPDATGQTVTWTITNPIDGTVLGAGLDFSFSGFNLVAGGSADDVFALSSTIPLTIVLDGGDGVDQLDYSDLTTPIEVNLATGTASGIAGFLNMEEFLGSLSTGDVLQGQDTGNTFTIAGNNLGNIDNIFNFSSMENLQGGAGNDRFELTGGTLSGVIDGQDGQDTFAGDDVSNTFTVTSVNAGTATGINGFNNIENLEGGLQNDRFELTGGTLSGLIDGKDGQDTFAGDDVSSTFTVTSLNSGTATGISGFSNIENLEGGVQSDRFELAGGTLSGTIDGQDGQDTFAADDVTNTFTVTALNSGIATGINGFSNIENLEGGTQNDRFELTGGTLSGVIDGQDGQDTFAGDDVTNIFTVTALNSGIATGISGFSNIENLEGGTQNDRFELTGGTLSGIIDGQEGEDTFAGDDVSNTFTVTALNSGTATGINGFSNIENLEGGTQSDRFELVGGTLSGVIDGQDGEDTLAGDDVTNTFTVTSVNAGIATGMNGFSNVENLEGGTGSDSVTLATGQDETLTLTGATTFNAASIQTGAITTNGGSITLNSTQGSITSTGSLQTSATDQGGSITLIAPGAITTGDLNTSGNSGGNLSVQSQTAITTGAITTQGFAGRGGDVLLDPPGDVQVTYIDARGTTQGGNVSITTGSLFRATGLIPGTLDSISTAGSLTGVADGGSLTLYHNGVSLGEFFVVGNGLDPLASNGTLGGISSGNLRIPVGQYGQTVAVTVAGQFDTLTGLGERPNINLIVDGILNPTPSTPPFTPEAACPPDCIENTTPEIDLPLLDLPTLNSIVKLSVEEVETEFTDDVAEYNGVDRPPLRPLPDIQGDLKAVEEATGVKPAIIYVVFTPTTVNTQEGGTGEGETGEGETEEKVLTKPGSVQPWGEPEVLWEFSDSASPLGLAQAGIIGGVNRQNLGSDELELVLVTSTGDPLRVRVAGANRTRVEQAAFLLRQEVSDPGRTNSSRYLQPSRLLYNWIIRPLETALAENGIENLVFVMDSGLRSLPVAALNDGEQFLIEKYSAGMMPSLSLTDTRYRDIRQSRLLGMGSSTFQDQSDLPTVPLELKTIAGEIWENGEYYLNEEFTIDNLRNRSEQFGIIHLATHPRRLPTG